MESQGNHWECLWFVAVGMAWISGSQVQGHKIRGAGSGSQESLGVLKVRAKVHTDAGRALRVIRRWTQVPRPFLLQAA